MTSKPPVCPPPAIKGAASAVAAPAAPALGAGTRFNALMQSGAGMLFTNLSLAAPVRAASKRAAFKAWAESGVAATGKRSAGAAAPRGFQPLPVGNHGENLNESQA